ncbi:hypothetical protein MCEMSE15_00413 [Fimbriimonadaceae bacterium]
MPVITALAIIAMTQTGAESPKQQPKGLPAKKVAAPKPKTAEQIVESAIYNRLNQQADIWFKDGDYPKIIQMLKIQNGFDPADYEAATNLGWLLESIEKADEATEVYDRYALLNPNDPDAALPRAQQHFLKRRWKEAAAAGEKFLTAKAHPNLWRIVANSYERLDEFKKSRGIWERYLKLHPNDASAKARLATVKKKEAEKQP